MKWDSLKYTWYPLPSPHNYYPVIPKIHYCLTAGKENQVTWTMSTKLDNSFTLEVGTRITQTDWSWKEEAGTSPPRSPDTTSQALQHPSGHLGSLRDRTTRGKSLICLLRSPDEEPPQSFLLKPDGCKCIKRTCLWTWKVWGKCFKP